MKKLLEIGFIALFAMTGFALENIPLPTGGGFYEGKVYQPRMDSATGTTATASYTPRFIGELLLGKTSGSNAVWVARGLTTNDWGIVTPSGGKYGAQDLDETDAYTMGDLTVTGTVTIAEGALANQTVVSADIKYGTIVNTNIATNAAIAATKIAGTAVTYSTAGQSDTNTTTDCTLKTPAFIGQLLVGSAGSGTNAAWIAKGTTTNDWVQVEP
ncbi:MAG: hypothetical protein PHW60_05690 [Kiritimatiellae bacterium]|nr:hypothetical protein [Kiritimatiellia bacterium]